MPPSSPPHLARPELRYATPETTGDFFAATLRGFHDDYVEDLWAAGRGVFEPERNFGFSVNGRWISTCGAYSRVLTVPGGMVPVAAVTFVTVQPSYRRRGILTQMMQHQLADIAERGREPVALLWASEAAIYGRFGYGAATPLLALTGRSRVTAFRPGVDLGDGSVGEVERDEAAPVIKRLHLEWLHARPGGLDRNDAWWQVYWHDPEAWRHGSAALRFALHFAAGGEPDGYLTFRVKSGGPTAGAEVSVVELDAATPQAYAALWRFVLDLDLVRTFNRRDAPLDEPLRHLVDDLRAVETTLRDGTYARLVDVRAALEARRYATEVDLVIDVTDPLLPHNHGRIRLRAGPDGASVSPSSDEPDLVLNVRELAAAYLGGVSLAGLHRAGLVTEARPGAVTAASAAFSWPRAPFCSDSF